MTWCIGASMWHISITPLFFTRFPPKKLLCPWWVANIPLLCLCLIQKRRKDGRQSANRGGRRKEEDEDEDEVGYEAVGNF